MRPAQEVHALRKQQDRQAAMPACQLPVRSCGRAHNPVRLAQEAHAHAHALRKPQPEQAVGRQSVGSALTCMAGSICSRFAQETHALRKQHEQQAEGDDARHAPLRALLFGSLASVLAGTILLGAVRIFAFPHCFSLLALGPGSGAGCPPAAVPAATLAAGAPGTCNHIALGVQNAVRAQGHSAAKRASCMQQ